MKEHELNTIMNVVADPDKCAVNIHDKNMINELNRIIRIFKINEEQSIKHYMFALKSMASMHLVLSNN